MRHSLLSYEKYIIMKKTAFKHGTLVNKSTQLILMHLLLPWKFSIYSLPFKYNILMSVFFSLAVPRSYRLLYDLLCSSTSHLLYTQDTVTSCSVLWSPIHEIWCSWMLKFDILFGGIIIIIIIIITFSSDII